MKYLIIFFNLILVLQSCHTQTLQDPNSMPMQEKRIIDAVNNNDTTAVIELLKNSVPVNTKDSKNRSLLLLATNHANFDMAKILVQHGANVNQQADNLDSPFLYAGATGQTEMLKLFLDHGARFDVFNRYNGTALIPACERGHIETVRLLANTKDFPINHINRLGWTGLMEAVILGDGSIPYQQIVQILKDAGAKLNIPDHDGVTALQHAKKKGFKEIVKILQD